MSPSNLIDPALPVVVTLWASRTRPVGRHDPHTWASFVETFVARPEMALKKESVAGFALTSFRDNRRALSNVEFVFALMFDLDEGDVSIEQAARLWRRTRAVIYTTYSSTPYHPKLRVIIALSRPVSSAEQARLWHWAAKRFARAKVTLDESTRDASGLWYIPSHPAGCTTYEWRELRGRPLDVKSLLRGAAHAPLLPEPAKRGTGPRRQTPSQEVAEARGAPASKSFWGHAFGFAGMALDPLKNGQLAVVCPWSGQHTSGVDGDGSTVILPPKKDGWGLFHCRHAHCSKRQTFDLLEALPAPALEAARIEHGSGLVRARVTHGLVQHLDAHDGLAALDRLMLWSVPVGYVARGGFRMTVKLGSQMHRALGSLPLEALLGRRVDVALRGSEVTWACLARRAALRETARRAAGGSR